MATCRSIVTGGLQLLGVYGGGEDPSAEDVATGMSALQSLFDAWVNSGMFGRLNDIYVTADYTAKEHDRVTAATGVTVTIPTVINNQSCWPWGFTGSVPQRAPRDLSVIEVSQDGAGTVHLYDRHAWVVINALTLDSECPLSTRGERGLMGCLAFQLQGDFNMQAQPNVVRLASQFRTMISVKYGSTQDPTPVEYM